MKVEAEYKEDLDRLESVIKNQKKQKKLFQNDIKNLRLKSRPLPPVCVEKRGNLLQKMVQSSEEKDVTSLDADWRTEKEAVTEGTSLESEGSEKAEDTTYNENRSKKIVSKAGGEDDSSRTAAIVRKT